MLPTSKKSSFLATHTVVDSDVVVKGKYSLEPKWIWASIGHHSVHLHVATQIWVRGVVLKAMTNHGANPVVACLLLFKCDYA